MNIHDYICICLISKSLFVFSDPSSVDLFTYTNNCMVGILFNTN